MTEFLNKSLGNGVQMTFGAPTWFLNDPLHREQFRVWSAPEACLRQLNDQGIQKVEVRRFELLTPCMPCKCSTS